MAPSAAGLAIGDGARAALRISTSAGGTRIGGGAGRAGGRALAAAAADLRVDRHRVAGRRDGAGRAESRQRVQPIVRERECAHRSAREIDVARLVEGAGQVARLEQQPLDRGGIAGIGPQIAVAQFVAGDQRRAARQIDQNIGFGEGAVAGRAETQPRRVRRAAGAAKPSIVIRTRRDGRLPC